MCDELLRFRAMVLADNDLRRRVLLTRDAADPLGEFCTLAQTRGLSLTPEDVIGSGEEYSCNQTKSTNGGNPIPAACFDDDYEMFLFSVT